MGLGLPTSLVFATALTLIVYLPSVEGCAEGWSTYENSCYYFSFVDGPSTWQYAENKCQQLAGDNHQAHLASIHSVSENNFIFRNLLGAGDSWIGLNKNPQNNLWEWSDGSPVDYKIWGQYQPNDLQGIARCVRMNKQQAFWDDFPCDRAHAFVCKMANYNNGQ